MAFTSLDPTCIHLFTVRDKRFVLDVNSGVFFEVDDIVYRILEHPEELCAEDQIVRKLAAVWEENTVQERLTEVRRMIEQKQLFSEDTFSQYDRGRPPRLSTICLNVAHKCNLRCRYCFAHGGDYGHEAALMTSDVAERSVDFLIRESGGVKDLSVSFFGGEPLLNFKTIKHTVAYANVVGQSTGKRFRFHITTNGILLSNEVLRFIERHQLSMIVSLDGPKDVNDSMRVFTNGKGSYDLVRKSLERIHSSCKGRPLTVRSTFTRHNLEVDELAMHLAQIGCADVSVEPCATHIEELQFTEADIEILKQRYDTLAERYLDQLLSGRRFSFFHFRQAMEQARKKTFRFSQCGAANGYVAVGADGKIYPCHKFVGNDSFILGDVFNGFCVNAIQKQFHAAHVRSKPKCMACWARYACGGGCHSHAITFNRDILEPYDTECRLIRHRIELGAYLYASLFELQVPAGQAADLPYGGSALPNQQQT